MSTASRKLLRAYKNQSPVIAAPNGFPSLVLDEQFLALDPTRWHIYDNSTFGAPTRIQRYMAYNAVTGTAAGAMGGTSLRLKSVREDIGGNAFTAGMLDTKTAGYGIPLYCYFEIRHKIPHGQGLWPAAWLTSRIGGASVCEFDIMEYFHSQVPGHLSVTVHRADSTGTLQKSVGKNPGGSFFEPPTYTPGWVISAGSIEPENGMDATGGVRFKAYLNGAVIMNYLDLDATWWTSHGSTDLSTYWNIYLQGCQIDGEWVGNPDDYLGYSAQLVKNNITGNCLISGTPPATCTNTYRGYNIIRAGAPGDIATITGQDATTYEIDYIRVWSR